MCGIALTCRETHSSSSSKTLTSFRTFSIFRKQRRLDDESVSDATKLYNEFLHDCASAEDAIAAFFRCLESVASVSFGQDCVALLLQHMHYSNVRQRPLR